MAIPPEMFPTVAEALASVGLHERGRIVVEKPFGRDLQSAIELNETLHSIFPEERIFRIDHYLGKEAVEDLLVFRFSNMMLEPIWNRRYVRSVQVTMAESIGVEGRGSFYDSVGAIRDVMQNHLLQVVSLLAMEPPVDPDASFLQDEKSKVLAAMEPVDPMRMVRGQYVGYREEPGVDPQSTTETFVAARLEIDSWRWAGVPWYVRVGKGLAQSVTEAVIELREPPQLLFDEAGGAVPERNLIRLRLGERDGVTFTPPGQDARAAPRQPEGRRLRRLRRRAGRTAGRLRAPAQRRHRRFTPALRPRGRRRAHVAGGAARARRARPDPPLLPRDVGTGGGRPDPRGRHLVRALVTRLGRLTPPRGAGSRRRCRRSRGARSPARRRTRRASPPATPPAAVPAATHRPS